MIVTIPNCKEHDGSSECLVTIEIDDFCPVCGAKRGTPTKGFSYDGSKRLTCETWINPCGHIDVYTEVTKEYKKRESINLSIEESLITSIRNEIVIKVLKETSSNIDSILRRFAQEIRNNNINDGVECFNKLKNKTVYTPQLQVCTRMDIGDCHARSGTNCLCMNGMVCPPLEK